MTCLRTSLNVALEWYITFLIKQWCKALMGEHGISEKEGPEAIASLSFPELAISLVGKAHVTKMKLNLNLFPLGLQIPQISYCIFKKPVICTTFNYVQC